MLCVCVHSYYRVVAIAAANGELLATTITMNDEERLKLMERFKKHELSESQVLSKVTNNMCAVCVFSVYVCIVCVHVVCMYCVCTCCVYVLCVCTCCVYYVCAYIQHVCVRVCVLCV